MEIKKLKKIAKPPKSGKAFWWILRGLSGESTIFHFRAIYFTNKVHRIDRINVLEKVYKNMGLLKFL